MKDQILSQLESIWGNTQGRVFSAPARINIIGEHVDYLGGLVLPAAIQFSTQIAIGKNQLGQIRLYSTQYKESFVLTKKEFQKEKKWANYVLGVLFELEKDGYILDGIDIIIDGNIPQGAGLSSSASLEVAVGYAISELFGFSIPKEKIAVIGQRAENNFVGTQCGIMDQFIIAVGKEDYCILLDTSNLKYEYKKINLGNCEFFLINSNVKHSLDTSEYNARRTECDRALMKIQKISPEYKNLYDLPVDIDLTQFKLELKEFLRVQHVLGEKKRTQDILHYFEAGQPENAGRLLYQTHESLSTRFEVSCEETDFLVESLHSESVLGARMIGGGFGGCILALDHKGRMERIRGLIEKTYFDRFSKKPEFYKFTISDGVKEL
jgi:galactokinase